jgi:hypothetical protein
MHQQKAPEYMIPGFSKMSQQAHSHN